MKPATFCSAGGAGVGLDVGSRVGGGVGGGGVGAGVGGAFLYVVAMLSAVKEVHWVKRMHLYEPSVNHEYATQFEVSEHLDLQTELEVTP